MKIYENELNWNINYRVDAAMLNMFYFIFQTIN